MKIAITDDIEEEIAHTRSLVKKYAESRKFTPEISTFFSAEEFLASGEYFDIAILDILMKKMNGIEAAEEMRKTNSETKIIFLTTSRDFAVEAFAVNAANYLVKPFSAEQINEAMDRILNNTLSAEAAVTLRCDDGLRKVELNSVEFFEIQKHNLYINLSSNEQLKARSSMKAIREEIGENEDFIPCGASYFLNLRHILSIGNFAVTMKSGRKIPVPRRCVQEIEKSYLRYCRREAGG